MNKYTIYCTEEQTRKALQLGAPIEVSEIPTTEQIIGWLEERNVILSIVPHDLGTCGYVYDIDINDNIYIDKCYYSRKEAILAAIDKALEYLSDNNLIK